MAQRPTVLIVEDDEDLSRMLDRLLRDHADVARAGDGREALDWLGSHPAPAAIVTDRSMPRVDGLALVRALKAEPRLRYVPVMMLTANASTRSTIDAINAGVRHHVAKPFKPADLVSKVKAMLAESRGAIRPSLRPTAIPAARARPAAACDLSSLVAALGSDDHEEMGHLEDSDLIEMGPA